MYMRVICSPTGIFLLHLLHRQPDDFQFLVFYRGMNSEVPIFCIAGGWQQEGLTDRSEPVDVIPHEGEGRPPPPEPPGPQPQAPPSPPLPSLYGDPASPLLPSPPPSPQPSGRRRPEEEEVLEFG